MTEESRNYDEWDNGLEIDFEKIYSSLKKGIKWLIITPTIFVIISIIYVLFIAKPVYTSEAKILVVNSEGSKSSLVNMASQFGFSLPRSSSINGSYLTVETLPEILKSRSLASSLLYSEFETEHSNKPRELIDILFNLVKYSEEDSNKLRILGESYISKNILGSKQLKNTNIMSLFAFSPDAKLSAAILDKVIDEINSMQIDYSRVEISNQKQFILERLAVVKGELFNAESKLKNFRETNLQINMSPALLLEKDRLDREIDIQTEIYISLKQQFEQIKINENKTLESIKVIDEPSVPIARSKPKRKMIVLVAGFLGITFGALIAIVVHKND